MNPTDALKILESVTYLGQREKSVVNSWECNIQKMKGNHENWEWSFTNGKSGISQILVKKTLFSSTYLWVKCLPIHRPTRNLIRLQNSPWGKISHLLHWTTARSGNTSQEMETERLWLNVVITSKNNNYSHKKHYHLGLLVNINSTYSCPSHGSSCRHYF